jgi:hypothetical protein
MTSIDGRIMLCTYPRSANVYMDGTVGLTDLVSGKSLGFFHLTAMRLGGGGVVLESRRLE